MCCNYSEENNGRTLNLYIYIQYMKTLRPVNIKQGKKTNPNNSFFSEKKKELLGWDLNPRHTVQYLGFIYLCKLHRKPIHYITRSTYPHHARNIPA